LEPGKDDEEETKRVMLLQGSKGNSGKVTPASNAQCMYAAAENCPVIKTTQQQTTEKGGKRTDKNETVSG